MYLTTPIGSVNKLPLEKIPIAALMEVYLTPILF